MRASGNNVSDYNLIFWIETERAIGVKRDECDDDILWLPKSQIEISTPNPFKGEIIEVTIPDWLATQRGLA